jgi:hypothetical protein
MHCFNKVHNSTILQVVSKFIQSLHSHELHKKMMLKYRNISIYQKKKKKKAENKE